jgi:hypothetical protein
MQCSKHLARRYDSATRAANTGATVAQLEAIFGWEGGAMASPYTRAAERRRLALESMRMLANNHRTSIAAPSKKGAAFRHFKRQRKFSGRAAPQTAGCRHRRRLM